MKKVRLDQILYRLGYTSDEQIKRALINQKQHGGRLGSNLLEMKYITEEQLTQALSMQYEVPAFHPPQGKNKPPEDLLKIVSVEFVGEHLVIPVRYDSDSKSLSIVIADPEDEETISAIGRLFKSEKVVVSLAPESVIKRLIASWYGLNGDKTERQGMIELPDLFGDGPAEQSGTAEELNAGEKEHIRSVLMVSDAVFLRNFLTPIFEREGLRLVMHSKEKDVLDLLDSGTIDHVLLSKDKSEEFDSWIQSGSGPERKPEVSVFSSISSALLNNPVPYSISVSSTIRALRIAAEARSTSGDPSIPYDLICRDVKALAREAGLKQIASDGIQMASLLFVPEGISMVEAHEKESGSTFSADTDRYIELARTLQFPWNIAGAISSAVDLISGRLNSKELETADSEVALGAQIITLAWHRHVALRQIEGTRTEVLSQLKTGLRDCSERIARSDIVESYIRHIEQNDDTFQSAPFQQIFIIGDVDSVVDQFASHLKHLGYHLVRIYDIDEASRMSERLSPTAILIDENSYRNEISRCKELFSVGEPIPVFAATADFNPSHILDLFDVGFDEVFAPPFELDIVAARIARTIESKTASSKQPHKPGGFSAEFRAFSFIDLLQALNQSLKSVHITLTGPDGEQADIYMDQGKPVAAECGEISGIEAIYSVITWQDNGSFVVEPEDKFPRANIEATLNSILMEGCRLLDESKA